MGPRRRERLRGPRSQDQGAQVDRHPRRPDLQLALAAPRLRGSLRMLGLEGEVREGLRGGVDQGGERRPLRRHRALVADTTASNGTAGACCPGRFLWSFVVAGTLYIFRMAILATACHFEFWV